MADSAMQRFLEERDAEDLAGGLEGSRTTSGLLAAREADRVMRPITRFARGHMSHNLSLMTRWPDLETAEEREEAVREWYAGLGPRIDGFLDEFFDGERSADIRAEFLAAGFREAISHTMACSSSQRTPQAKLWRQRLSSRAIEIVDVLATKIDTSLSREAMRGGVIIIIVWGEHGAHFPDT